jgi:hypothetical protein
VSPSPVDDSSNAVPEQLAALARREMTVMDEAPDRAIDVPLGYERHPIGPTVSNRLRGLARQEARSRQPRIVTPGWSQETALPGLIIAQRYVGGDAFGIARQTAELDMAVRRAVALMKLMETGERVTAWPQPIRPRRGGLWLLDARYGSLDLLWTVYGSIVTVATSTPISLASFASLAWLASRSASRMAHRWVVRPLAPSELAHRPSAGDPVPSASHGDTWEERTTKRMIPVFKLAISEGSGIDYRATGPSGEVRFIVPPRADTDATDRSETGERT